MAETIQVSRTDWFDLPVPDLADAMSFYEGLLSWTYKQMEESPIRDYVMIEVGGKFIGGLRQIRKEKLLPSDATGPILYFTVDNLSHKVSRAKELGATIIGDRVDLGKGRGRYQWIRDRAGIVVALWEPS